MIKAIIFDVGGVLTQEPMSLEEIGRKCASKFGKDADAFECLVKENWSKAKINEISSQTFWHNLSEYLNIDKETVRKHFIDVYHFNQDVLDFAKELKKDYTVALLSNQIEDWLEEIIEKHGLRQVFDVIVTSYESRKKKPDIDIYEEMVYKLGLKPEECIFIDDSKENINTAKELGMETILFKNLNQLKRDLSKLI